jgi:hypothetical protein
MVEVIKRCAENGHEFVVTYDDPVNWGDVNSMVAKASVRCVEHPESQEWYNTWE